jgi:hypothetical protein
MKRHITKIIPDASNRVFIGKAEWPMSTDGIRVINKNKAPKINTIF